MPIKQICSKSVVTVEKDATIVEVAKLMRKRHVGSIIVTEIKAGQCLPVGIITDRDLVTEVIANGVDFSKVTAGDIMSSDLATVQESAGVYDVLKSMGKNGVARVPVVDKGGDLVGLLSADDVIGMLAKELAQDSKIKSKQIQTERQSRS